MCVTQLVRVIVRKSLGTVRLLTHTHTHIVWQRLNTLQLRSVPARLFGFYVFIM